MGKINILNFCHAKKLAFININQSYPSMINNFVICGFLSVLLFYGISSYGIIFGESNNTRISISK